MSFHRRKGVILVLVLLMLTLCASIAAQVASRTIRLTGEAAASQRELQERWAIVSIRRSILNDAPTLLTDPIANLIIPKSIPVRQENLVLGGNCYQILIQDESAKAPIAQMLLNKNQQEVKPILRQLLQRNALLQSKIPSNPQQWRQVIDIPSSTTATESFERLREAATWMTLWSDGRLNIMTADRKALDAVWRHQFNAPAPEAIANLRQSNTTEESFDQRIRGLGLSERQLSFARMWLTTTSTSYSLWISQTTANGSGDAMVYVRRSRVGFAEEHFGFHQP